MLDRRATDDPIGPAVAEPAARQPVRLVAVLTLAYALAFTDRQIIALLVDPIKHDLHASDVQMGMLQGIAFAIFYAVFGLPMGRIADLANRRKLVATGISAWSIMTALCGTVATFPMLFLARIGVGVGEAALTPSAWSMISDSVPKRHLSLALSVYSMGMYVGSAAALLIGGALLSWLAARPHLPFINTVAHWRLTMFTVGAIGLVPVVLILMLREPARRNLHSFHERGKPGLGQTASYIRAHLPVLGWLFAGYGAYNVANFAVMAWLPAFFGRAHGLPTAEVGLRLGVPLGLGGCLGVFVGGSISDWLFRQGRGDAPLLIGVAAMAGFVPFLLATLYAPNLTIALLMAGMVFLMLALPIGPSAAALQLILPNRYRGQVSALFLLTLSLSGVSLGPLLPPLINRWLSMGSGPIGAGIAAAATGAAMISIVSLLIGRKAYARRYHELFPAEAAGRA